GRVVNCLGRVDRDDPKVRVAVGVEVVGADRTLETLGRRHRRAHLLAGGDVAAVVLDGPSDGLHQGGGCVVGLDGVATQVVRPGECLAVAVEGRLGPRNLGGVRAGGGRVDVEVVAAGVVDALRGLDAVTTEVRHVETDSHHLRASHTSLLVVGAADVEALR